MTFLYQLLELLQNWGHQLHVFLQLDRMVQILIHKKILKIDSSLVIRGKLFPLLLKTLEKSNPDLFVGSGVLVALLLEHFAVILVEDPVHVSDAEVSIMELSDDFPCFVLKGA